jgi:hypothetical protein
MLRPRRKCRTVNGERSADLNAFRCALLARQRGGDTDLSIDRWYSTRSCLESECHAGITPGLVADSAERGAKMLQIKPKATRTRSPINAKII